MTRDEFLNKVARNIAAREWTGKPDQTISFDAVYAYTQFSEHEGSNLLQSERRDIVKKIEQLYTSANSGYKMF